MEKESQIKHLVKWMKMKIKNSIYTRNVQDPGCLLQHLQETTLVQFQLNHKKTCTKVVPVS